MSIEVRLPQIAESMTSAKLVAWLKREGDTIAAGEPIAEIETDKTTVELEAPGSGVLQTIQVAADTDAVPVGALLAVIAEQGSGLDLSQGPTHTNSGSALAPATAIASEESTARASSRPIVATPLATRMARLAELDLSAIRAKGADGRITKADVEAVLERRRSADVVTEGGPAEERLAGSATPGALEAARSAGVVSFEDRPLSAMRRVTATRLQLAKQTIPHFYLHVDCVVDALIALRAAINADREAGKVTITDFIVLATALALRQVPLANSAWRETAVRVYDSVDIAVAVNTPKGLITPVVRASHLKNLLVISRELRGLVERARIGHLRPDEYTGGTFTVSNLGMFGVTDVSPIINPPQSGILGVGAIEQRPVVTGGQLAVARVMSCTLAVDHRAVDGATAAELLTEIRRLIQEPALMGAAQGLAWKDA